MHLHFVQSLEPLQGPGLGQAALSLHLAMRETKSPKDEKTNRQEMGDRRLGAVFSRIRSLLQAPRSPLNDDHVVTFDL